jgi:4,5-dihydroxyphthalate decarboxylase
VYPINHGLVVKDSVLHSNPGLALSLCNAFEASKNIYLARLDAGEHLSPADEIVATRKGVVGDPFPQGFSANRKTIETINHFAADQGVISKPFEPEGLFAPETL